MPKANWGVSTNSVDDYDRSSQYTPYDGPVPVNGVYRWHVKKLVMVAATGSKLPQLRVGLELTPRSREEKQYTGYYITAFLPVSDRTAFRYVPFLDALGVKGREFTEGTIIDEEGNVKRIGKFRMNDSVFIKAQLKDDQDKNGNPQKGIGWMGADTGESFEDDEDDSDEEYGDDDAYADEDGDDEWE